MNSIISDISLSGLAAVISNPWAGIASAVLLVRNYRLVLTRLCCIVLLLYWYVYISNDHYLCNQILVELMRSKTVGFGAAGDFDKHWTLQYR